MGKKQQVIEEIYRWCQRRENPEFDNDNVKRVCARFDFKNPFDVTKVDSSVHLPAVLVKDDVFIAHLGKGGRHRFVKGIKAAYHKFESISPKQIKPFEYRESILNNINDSESNSLFVAYNQQILQDFLYQDRTAVPKVYGSHRTKFDIRYIVGKEEIVAQKLQMEIDLTLENNGEICIFEAKNGSPIDFNVYQLFNPFRYYVDKHGFDPSAVQCCYLLRLDNSIKLFLYKFNDVNELGSIQLIRNAEYRLVKR